MFADKDFTPQGTVKTADAADPGYVPAIGVNGYEALFDSPTGGLPPQDTRRYTRSIGLRVGPAMSFTVNGWRRMMAQHGALGVVGLTPFLHIRVITELKGDGSVFGTFFTVHDPGRTRTYTEAFVSFSDKYESAAYIDHRMDQIWHR